MHRHGFAPFHPKQVTYKRKEEKEEETRRELYAKR